MSITITINSETAAEAQAQVLDLSAVMGGNPAKVAAAPSETPKRNRSTNKPVENPEKPKDAVPQDDPAQTETEKDEAETPPATDHSEGEGTDDPGPVPTAVDLRAKAGEVGADPAKKPKIKALLNEFGVPNITAIPEDRRVEFMKALEAL